MKKPAKRTIRGRYPLPGPYELSAGGWMHCGLEISIVIFRCPRCNKYRHDIPVEERIYTP